MLCLLKVLYLLIKKNLKWIDIFLVVIFFLVYFNGGGLVNSFEKIWLFEYDSKRFIGDRKYIGI